MTRSRRPLLSVWRVPLLLALLTVAGLLSALLGTGVWRALAWVCLAVPIGSALRLLARRDAGAP